MTFAALANTKLGDIKDPVKLPIGHYQAQFTGPFKEHTAKSGNQAARFPMRVIAPGDDVDAAELEAAGGLPDKEFTYDFWMTPESLYRFRDVAKNIFEVGEQAELAEALEIVGSSGTPFLIEVKHEQDSRDPTKSYVRLDNIAPLS